MLQLDGEEIVDAVPDIGYHHRGAEKMGERQTWHTYIPYTDRVDYLGGVMNNLPYVLAVEKLAGIEVPDRAKVIRVMLAELFRIISHLVWYGTFAAGPGRDVAGVLHVHRPRAGLRHRRGDHAAARMHPSWFRIGGVAQDLPQGWDRLVRDFLRYMPRAAGRVRQAGDAEPHLQGAHAGHRRVHAASEAIEWGVTGPGLRACGLGVGLPQEAAYSGYEQFEFDIPTGAARRLLRPGGGARRGDAPEPADHRAVPEQHARRRRTSPTIRWPRRRSRSARCTTSRR